MKQWYALYLSLHSYEHFLINYFSVKATETIDLKSILVKLATSSMSYSFSGGHWQSYIVHV